MKSVLNTIINVVLLGLALSLAASIIEVKLQGNFYVPQEVSPEGEVVIQKLITAYADFNVNEDGVVEFELTEESLTLVEALDGRIICAELFDFTNNATIKYLLDINGNGFNCVYNQYTYNEDNTERYKEVKTIDVNNNCVIIINGLFIIEVSI